MQKLNIPKEIQVGGQKVKVDFCDELGGKLGKCCAFNGFIKIANGIDGCLQTDSSKLNTFIHECVHLVLDTMGREDLSGDETFVSSFAGFATEIITSIKKDES